MFLGHFAVAFAAKQAVPSVSLGTLFVAAAHWVDKQRQAKGPGPQVPGPINAASFTESASSV